MLYTLHYNLAVVANLIALGLAVWLGIYIITRSPRSAVAWLAGLTLWSIGSWFFDFLLALNPPPAPALLTMWLKPLLWLWPPGAFEQGPTLWLQGWLITPSIMLWHHATVLMRYGPMNRWRWSRVLVGYAISIAAIIGQRSSSLVFVSYRGDPLYLTFLAPGPLYPIYMAALLLFLSFCLINLNRSARDAPTPWQRKQLNLMALATLIAGSSGIISYLGDILRFPLPRVTLTLVLGFAVFLLGYGVARYSALVEGRLVGRDFLYNGAAVAVVATVYLLAVWASVVTYKVPVAAITGVMVLAILTHSLVDVSRRLFDLVFYRRETRELRDRLRRLVQQANAPEALEDSLSLSLETLCRSVAAIYAFILLFKEDELYEAASYHGPRLSMNLHPADLASDDVVTLPHAGFQLSLEEAALLIPLYAGEVQQGVLVLGRPQNALSYSDSDVESLLDPSDRIADALRDSRRESEHLARLAQMAQTPALMADLETELPTRIVEDALRNLFDYAYLADSPLARLKQAQKLDANEGITHLDRGKQVYRIMLDTMEKLRPPGDLPREPVPRQWYPYLILHEAYLENKPNNEIMMRLYISEGTFNRTRRGAVRSMTRALLELGMVAQ